MYDVLVLPQAKNFLPAGLPQDSYVAHNRLRKAFATALRLFMEGVRARDVTAADMARAAGWVGVKVPGSDETRQLIVTILKFLEATPVPMATLAAAAPQAVVPVGKVQQFRAAWKKLRR